MAPSISEILILGIGGAFLFKNMEREKQAISIEQEIRKKTVKVFMEDCPLKHPDLLSATLGGSTSEGSSGAKSDIDITTVTHPKNPNKVDTGAILTIGSEIRNSIMKLGISGVCQPIVISTIRLEEAQMAMAELTGNPGLPVHWLHYPSLEFAKVNEPLELVKGLLLNGVSLFGNQKEVVSEFEKIDAKKFTHLAGLDWLTDSFKILIANTDGRNEKFDLQPRSFLFGLATHNLEYFWKWRIIGTIIERKTGKQIKGWKNAEESKGLIDPEIWNLAQHVRKIRHESPKISLSEIINLHKNTFDLWPDFKINTSPSDLAKNIQEEIRRKFSHTIK